VNDAGTSAQQAVSLDRRAGGFTTGGRMNHRSILVALLAGVLTILLSGCAAVQTQVLPGNAEEQRSLRALMNAPTTAARAMLARSTKGSEAERLACLLESARLALPGSLRGNTEDTVIYRGAIRQVVELQQAHEWRLQPTPVAGGAPALSILREGRDLLDPLQPTRLVPSDQIRISGLRERSRHDGLGLPYVAWFPRDARALAGEPGLPPSGMAIPATAVLTFTPRGAAVLQFVRSLSAETMVVKGRPRVLAADFSAPVAVIIAKGVNRRFDVPALLAPLDHLSRSGLYQFQPYDPSKIPVVFVHGLLGRPETWTQALNELQADPEIRRHYQFWFYLYPTGLPVWKSAALLRAELDRFNKELTPRLRTAADRARLNRKVLVGHSMGGLLSSLQIREGGRLLTRQLTDKEIDELPISPAARQRVRVLVEFSPRRDVSRVVFIAVPHHGSPTALLPGATLLAMRIRSALPDLLAYRDLILPKLHDELRRELAVSASSLQFLRANSPLLRSIYNLPRDERIAVHSILGDRGRNDAPQGGDGVVPFWSAHFPGAASEKIVPAGHDVHDHPEGIREVGRILRQAL